MFTSEEVGPIFAFSVLNQAHGGTQQGPWVWHSTVLECHDRSQTRNHMDQRGWTKSFWAICHLCFCFSTYKSVHLLWHLCGFSRLLSCQHCSTVLTLSLNYTITLLCTVDLVIKYLKCVSTDRIFKKKICFESSHLANITNKCHSQNRPLFIPP